jgi:uncharacterized protein
MVGTSRSPRIEAAFARIVRYRWAILTVYALLVPGALVLALRIPSDSSLERMIVASHPDVVATREFQRIFPERPAALLLVESPDPLSRETVAAAWALETALNRIPGVSSYSALTVLERLRPGAASRSDAATDLKRLVSGTAFFREQGLVSSHALGLVLALDVKDRAGRDAALDAIDRVTAEVRASESGRSGIAVIRRVGRPWVDSWLERETGKASLRYFPVFGAFVVLLTYSLYRSVRALVAILASLGVAVLLGVSLARLMGFGFTIVSSLVPLTLMITTSASLIYLHSRFVDQPADVQLERHRVEALANKLAPVSISMFAAAVGFAALAVSEIVPIRQLGVWTSCGIGIGWVVCFTLYPALQTILRAPTRRRRAVAGSRMVHAAVALPRWSYRWRWVLLPVVGVLGAAGFLAFVGVPGTLTPMRLATDALDYVDPNLPVVGDTRAFADTILGRTSVSVWVTVPNGTVLAPETIGALDALSRAIRRQSVVGSVVGLPAILGLRRYASGQGDTLPSDPAELARATSDVEQLLLTEPAVAAWVDMSTLGSTYLTVTSRAADTEGFGGLERAIGAAWDETRRRAPGLSKAAYKIVGTGVLEDHISAQLVPTLTKSFGVTLGIIFLTFLLVFRSGPARLIAMVPSLFAILVMFLVMRLAGIQLNVATILIATTVLGATENDQVHFFYHFQEARNGATTEQALGHAILVAGHAIVFATVINAGGFLALILSSLPPMRQFGILMSLAFMLALLADATALLASLWVVFGERPQAGTIAKIGGGG